jgi:ATP-dependent protease ClpP protease subunit
MNNTKNRFFNAAKSDDTLTLSIYDVIGADFFGEGITASQVQDALKGDHKNVTVRVNSPGGNAFEGVAIYNLLNSHRKPVNVIVDGLAASAASIICMAGETVTMNDGAMMMIHEAQAVGTGTALEIRQLADTLDAVTSSIADIYVASTGMPKDKVLGLMSDETWMSAAEAKANGFATAVSDAARVSNSFDLSAFKFKHVPKNEVEVDYSLQLKRIEIERRK